MDDTFAVTIVCIVLVTMVAAFIRRVQRDKCLKDFANNTITLEQKTSKITWGRLNVENTGLEFVYTDVHKDTQGHDETTFLLYKNEFPTIQTMIRFHHQLSDNARRLRDIDLEQTYHPTSARRLCRKTLNVFKTIRDSVLEVINLLITQAKKATPAGAVLSQQDKYVSQMKQELVGSAGTSYEPLLEKYIGCKVVVEIAKADKILEYPGVLKEYTAEFLEVMDVNYKLDDADEPAKADIIVPRANATVRHLAE